MPSLTEHITLESLTASDTAVRLGIDNSPPAEVIPRLGLVALKLEEARAILGGRPIFPTSGYRCEALERVLAARDYERWSRARGKILSEESWREYFETKDHPLGWAADWVCPGFGDPHAIVIRLREARFSGFDQLIEEGVTKAGGGWVHTSVAPRQRGEILIATFKDGVPSYERVA